MELSSTLFQLSQRVLQSSETSRITICKQLLLDISSANFYGVVNPKIDNFRKLKTFIAQYYMRVLNEQVLRIDNEQDEFLEVYELILDQALTYKKELYISEMLALGEEAKATLKPFVEAVMRRQFVRKIPNDNAIDNMCQIYEKETLLMEKEEEIEGLKEKNEHLQQLLKQCKQSCLTFRNLQQIANEELHELTFEKSVVLSELGCSGDNYKEIIHKYKQEVAHYQKVLSISQKEIEEKNKALQEKDKLLKEASLAQDKHWQEERDRILERNKELEKDILRFASKEEDSQLEILRLKELLLEKEAVIAKQSKTISTMENYEARFNEIVKLHSRFKSTIVSNCKLRGLQDSDMGRSKYARSQQTL